MWRWPIAIVCSLLRVLVTLVSYGKWLNRPRFWLGVQTRVNLREHRRFGDHSRYLRGQESPSNGAFLRAMDIFEKDNVRIFFPHAVNLTLNWLAAAAVGCHSKFSQWTIHPLRRGLRPKIIWPLVHWSTDSWAGGWHGVIYDILRDSPYAGSVTSNWYCKPKHFNCNHALTILFFC